MDPSGNAQWPAPRETTSNRQFMPFYSARCSQREGKIIFMKHNNSQRKINTLDFVSGTIKSIVPHLEAILGNREKHVLIVHFNDVL